MVIESGSFSAPILGRVSILVPVMLTSPTFCVFIVGSRIGLPPSFGLGACRIARTLPLDDPEEVKEDANRRPEAFQAAISLFVKSFSNAQSCFQFVLEGSFDELDHYIHDYMKKHSLHEAAATFKAEARLPSHGVAIDSPEGFLHDWWSIFSDVFVAREQENLEAREAYIKAKQLAVMEQQHLHFQSSQVQPLDQPWVLQMNHSGGQSSSSGPPMRTGSHAKTLEEYLKQHSVRESESISHLVDVNILTASEAAIEYQRRIQQQALAQSQQRVVRDNGHGSDTGRSLPSETLLYGVPKVKLPRSRFCETGLNKGPNALPLNGWPLTGIDQIGPSMGPHLLHSMLQTPEQLKQLQPSNVQHLPKIFTQPHGNLVSSLSANHAEMDLQRLLLRGNLNGQTSQPCQQTAFSTQMTSVVVKTSQKDENNRNRKYQTHSGSGSSVKVGRIGVLPLSMCPPEGNVPLDEISAHGASSESHNAAEKQKKGDSQATSREAETSEREVLLLPLFQFLFFFVQVLKIKYLFYLVKDNEVGDNGGSFDDHFESFLSHFADDEEDGTGDARRISLNQGSSNSELSFNEVGCLRSSTGQVVCCHFSSDGKLLASAGHDMKVTVWNMDTFDFQTSADEHSLVITDIRFKPNSTFFATSSYDTTVKIWDAADPIHSLGKLVGHREQVTSLDFHPKKAELVCTCDSYGEIRWWNITKNSCVHVSKGGTRQVRIQPQGGQLLAAAEEKKINIFDIEADQLLVSLWGHKKEVSSICWHTSGDYMASVCEDIVCIWSIVSGWKCIHHLRSIDDKFQSCTFHPRYPEVLVIGGYERLALWDPAENRIASSVVHRGMIAALSTSPSTGMVASASHDQCVKLWK
ncbi:transcriptional corepressor LEUNIG_HOMOLOG-like [Aristolochia californica]|uniref:transcriptional corepressor LEUNIG_HOMOLOG-like n=1 Tax=Aristolochia californica TaxID=171875 RepID=UPI0035E195F3